MTNEELKKKRKKLRFTQKEMAQQLNIPLRTYQNYENTGEKTRRPVPSWMGVAINAIENREKE